MDLDLEIPAAWRDWIRLGCSSWKFDSWKGLVYDPEKKYRAEDYLADYARHFNSVEVDQWFWSLFPAGAKLPDPETARQYAAAVPKDFIFSVKVPNSITLTHFSTRQAAKYKDFAGRENPDFLSNDLLEKFLERIEPIHPKLGPLMFQFEYLNKKKMPSMKAFIDRFAEFIERAPKGFEYAVETRNPNYLSRPFFEFLTEKKLGFVFLEGYYMPPIADVFAKHSPHTAGFNVIRLHGGDREAIEKETGEDWSRVVQDRQDSIAAAAAIARVNRELQVRTFINFNNHFEGSAPLSAARFIAALGSGR